MTSRWLVVLPVSPAQVAPPVSPLRASHPFLWGFFSPLTAHSLGSAIFTLLPFSAELSREIPRDAFDRAVSWLAVSLSIFFFFNSFFFFFPPP